MTVRKYETGDHEALFEIMRQELDDWSDYFGPKGQAKYIRALEESLTYVVCENGLVCGYARCRDDGGFGIYVYDLLVAKGSRGNNYGRLLFERLRQDFPDDDIYVMSDVDPYYEKLGMVREGSILKL